MSEKGNQTPLVRGALFEATRLRAYPGPLGSVTVAVSAEDDEVIYIGITRDATRGLARDLIDAAEEAAAWWEDNTA